MTDSIIIATLIVASCIGWTLFVIDHKMYQQAMDERDDARRLAEHWNSRWRELCDQLALVPDRDPKTGRMKSRKAKR